MVDALGTDGTRYVLLREAAFDRDADVSWDSFLRRYNADLANDFGNLVNRTVTMARRYLGGERPAPRTSRRRPAGRGLVRHARSVTAPPIEGCRLHEALAEFAELVGGANRTVDAEQPWVLAKAAAAGDVEAAERLAACSAISSRHAACSRWSWRPSCRTAAPRVLAQLGYAYPYAADGNGGPPLLEELAWGAHADVIGLLGEPVPLFPRLDLEPAPRLTRLPDRTVGSLR